MPKMKTNSGSKKRFTLTGTGKIKRKHAFHSHILTTETKKQKRNLCYSTTADMNEYEPQEPSYEVTEVLNSIIGKD